MLRQPKTSKRPLAKGWHWQTPPKTWRFFLIAVLVIGIFFRFVNLDQKLYWRDETFTSLRIYGYTKQELTNEVTDGKIITKDFFQNYQKPNPEKGLFDVVKSLALEDPKHLPLYFVMTRLWTEIFGDSVAIIRSFSAFVSLLVFPSMYWLCLELFGSSFVAWIAIALIAVSPFHILYAQEARILNPPPSLQAQIKHQYQLELEPIYENNDSLWRLEK